MLNRGEELAWVCLGSCSLDVRHFTVPVSRFLAHSPSAPFTGHGKAVALFWMTTRAPAAAQHPDDVDVGPACYPSSRVRPASANTTYSSPTPRASLAAPKRALSAIVYVTDVNEKHALGEPDACIEESPLARGAAPLACGIMHASAHRVQLPLTLGAPSERRLRASSMNRIVGLLRSPGEQSRHRSLQASLAATAPCRFEGSLGNIADHDHAGL